jgi:hypothetical protein
MAAARARVVPPSVPPRANMNPDLLFLHSLADLAARIASADEYEVLRAAGILRQLLLDDQPLVHIVNRGPRLKLVFRMNGLSHYERVALEDKPTIFTMPALVVRDDLPAGLQNPVDPSLREFLARPVTVVNGEKFDVTDVMCRPEGNARGAPRADRRGHLRRRHHAAPGPWRRATDISLHLGGGDRGAPATRRRDRVQPAG